jgi:MYXO-CTERM domain-containing protein
MTGYTYLDNTGNPQATVTVLHENDYLISPSGVYNGVLTSNGTFVVSYGNKPDLYQSTWAVNPNWGSYQHSGPYTIQTVPQFINSQYYLYATHNSSYGWQWPIIAAENDTNTGPDFMQLNDDGTLSIYQGNNGIKTNPNEKPVFATVAPGYAVSPGFSGISVPVTKITLNTITYDTAHTVYNTINNIVSDYGTLTNNTDTQEIFPWSVSLAYTNTETFNWSTSTTLSATISSATKVAIPGIGEQTETISLTTSATISQGQSTSSGTQQTFAEGSQTAVPAHSVYKVILTAAEQDASIPYTWTGTAYYASGVSAPIDGTGIFEGDSTGVFNVEIDCVSQPSGCPPGGPLTVPEPPTFVTVPLAFAALLALAAVRRRRARGSSQVGGSGALRPA